MNLDPVDKLFADIDLDLHLIWEDIDRVCESDRELVCAIARAAWGRGYVFALCEERPGLFANEHGYRVPPRTVA